VNDEESAQLDRWLSEARWAQAAPGAQERLTLAWQHVWRREQWRGGFWRVAAAAAAAIVLVAGMSLMWRGARPPAPPTFVQVSRQIEILAEPPRRATPFEAAVAQAMDKRPPAQNAKVPSVAKVVAPAPVDVQHVAMELSRRELTAARRRELLASLAREASPGALDLYLDQLSQSATQRDALVALDRVDRPPVDALLRRLQDPLVARRLAAARALGWIDGPELTKRLADMARQNRSRREAMFALASSRGSEARQFVENAAQGGPLAGVAKSVLIQNELEHP
jgi:hypothetical protein